MRPARHAFIHHVLAYISTFKLIVITVWLILHISDLVSPIMGKRKAAKSSYSRLSPYIRGIIFGLFFAGVSYQDIADQVYKDDGTRPSKNAVALVVSKCTSEGGVKWDGNPISSGRGPERATTSAFDRQVVKLVFQHRGKAKVTVDFVRKRLKSARQLSRSTVARRLAEAGLAWLRRRKKSLVPEAHKQARMAFSRWVLTQPLSALKRWVYSDGTTFFLARSATEKQSQTRGALGSHVWRMADGSDGLYEDVVGPSSYYKAQGTCVRIWGLLVAGVLYVTVLQEGQAMNRWTYASIVAKSLPLWIRKGMGRKAKPILIQDHERALWTDEAKKAMKDHGMQLLES